MKILSLLVGILSLCVLSCFAPEEVVGDGGSATETVALTGNVEYPELASTTSLEGIRVSLRPSSFLMDTVGLTGAKKVAPLSVIDTSTDSLGQFRIKQIDPGEYRLEVNDGKGYAKLYTLTVVADRPDTLPKIILEGTGVLRGKVTYDVPPAETIVQIYGMERATTVSENGSYSFENMPSGLYVVRITPRSPNLLTVEANEVPVVSQDTTSVGHLVVSESGVAWVDSMEVFLNTTATGADIQEDVLAFSVPVALSEENFDFTKSTGADLRFVKRDGIGFPFEIEMWDEENQTALIWVKLDTVRANATDQSFVMYWGETSRAGTSDGPSVFSLADNYLGVWHLGEVVSGVGNVGVHRNSVEDANHGDDHITSSDNSGILGYGNYFDLGDKVIMPNVTERLKPFFHFTLSCWVKLGPDTSQSKTIVTMGDDYGIHTDSKGVVRVFISDSIGSGDYALQPSGENVNDGTWRHVHSVYDDSTLAVYVDGNFIAQREYPLDSINYNLGLDFKLGEHGINKTGFIFEGGIDEVRVSSVPRSSTWIKLEFESQKANSNFLTYRTN